MAATTDGDAAAAITAGEIREIVAVLAADSLEGREAATPGAERAASYVAQRFAALGLRPPAGGYLQRFEIPAGPAFGGESRLAFRTEGSPAGDGSTLFEVGRDFAPLGFSAEAAAEGPLALLPRNAERTAGSPAAGRAGAGAGTSTGESPRLAGAVVLIPGAGEDLLNLRARVAEAERAGAVAALVLSDPASLAIGGQAIAGDGASIPVLAVGFPAGETLARAAGVDLLAFAHGGSAGVRVPTRVTVRADLSDERATTANVIGIVEGTDPELREDAIVIGAHYDHLGWGGPGSLVAGVHAIHNGADDNASGVAGVLELAERFAARPPLRSLVFAAFGAEERGNLGSQFYVRHPAWPLERTLGMINLDMIGRLRERLTVYGTGTSPAWNAVLDSLLAVPPRDPGGRVPRLNRVPDGFGPSDHASFYGARVPVLAFFTGAHEDYHRPSDDADLIDAAGEVRVLELAAAVIDALARSGREVAYTDAPVTQRRPAPFKVALGTLPDYGFAGPGVRLSSVRPGSPADRAGLRSGDVILRLGGRDVTEVYAYTAILGDLEAGRPVELVYSRQGRRRAASVIPEGR